MNPRRHTLIALLIIVAAITAVARFESMSEMRARITKRYSGPEKTSAQNDVGFSDAVRSAKLHKLRGNTSDDARAARDNPLAAGGGAPAGAGKMPDLQQPAIGVADLLKHMAVMDAKIAALEASAAQSVPAELMSIAMPEVGSVVSDDDWYLRLYYDSEGSYDGSFAYWGTSSQSTDYDGIFDLYNINSTNDTLKVRGDSDDKLVCVAGTWIAVSGGTHELDAEIAISADTYIYITVKRVPDGTDTAKLESGSTKKAGDEDEENYLLWYIPFADSAITTSEIKRYRSSEIHIDTFM